MSGSRLRRTSGRVLMSAVILALPLALGGCLKGALPPQLDTGGFPPEWDDTKVTFSSQQVGNPATGWITTVTVPPCFDAGGTFHVVPVVSVSNGFISGGGGSYTWTRAVSGTPAVAASGVFTADCIDNGLHAHPVLGPFTQPALP